RSSWPPAATTSARSSSPSCAASSPTSTARPRRGGRRGTSIAPGHKFSPPPPARRTPPSLGRSAEARAGVLERLAPLPVREVPLADALGCVLAADIAAAEDLPPFANSAMDGLPARGAHLAGPAEPLGPAGS